ncbi:hypothetical protein GYMLUDRAFT_40294 [Collybiopsis luxurians FD-317 M1]|uniref:N-acetyltransferase domain-containing protein n=1 Tax=Collybiopsis luxurians FD-317 M1 TaxID=944289 RepID=A0A0D0CWA8_9AGAR|nr:hypothetical protein GYMLUDRAFT_40294 [Collybiopsis luxurians FD-317 M1]
MDLEQSPLLPKDSVLVRQFNPSDASQVQKVYFTGLVNGVNSAGYFAITRAFMYWTPMYMAYLLLLCGGGTYALAPIRDVRTLGLVAVILPCVFMLSVYYRIRTTFLGYYRSGLRRDMSDIERYYRLEHEKDGHLPRRFWVAEVPSATSEGGYEVVGCVALDCSPKTDHEPMIGELKRLFVLPAYRKRGIGTKLMRTLISYAKEKQISLLRLETTNFQPVARELYGKIGWTYNSTTYSDFEAGGMKMNFVEYRLSL